MTSHNSKFSIVLLSLVSIVLLIILTFGFYRVRANDREVSQLLESANQTAELENLARLVRAIQDKEKEDLATLAELTLSSDKLVPLIESVEEVGREFGLETDILSVGEIKDSKLPEPQVINLTIETQGPWVETLSFLRAIENLPHRVSIEETNLVKEEILWRSKIILAFYLFY